MFRQRLTVDQINTPLTDADLAEAVKKARASVDSLSKLPDKWVQFGQEKAALAVESAEFMIKQRLRFHRAGFPAVELDYLALIERQLDEIFDVFNALYNLNPGFVFQLGESVPEVMAWVLLHSKFQDTSNNNAMIAIDVISRLEPEMAKMLMLQTDYPDLDIQLGRLIEGAESAPLVYFECLYLRQSLSVVVIKHWLNQEKFEPSLLHKVLALADVEESVDWLMESATGDAFLYERLLLKGDRNTWFRQYLGTEPELITNKRVVTYAKLLEMKEFMAFDISLEDAAIHLILAGDTAWVPAVIEHMQSLDEVDGEFWWGALYVLYGDLLPCTPSDIGVLMEWSEALKRLSQWHRDDGYFRTKPIRLGHPLDFESTLLALRSPEIDIRLRKWLWRQLCLKARMHVPWDAMMSQKRQQQLFAQIEGMSVAAERFNLGSQYAAVGY